MTFPVEPNGYLPEEGEARLRGHLAGGEAPLVIVERADLRDALGELDAWRGTFEAIIEAMQEDGMTDDEKTKLCPGCKGCGKIANDDEQTPWTDWLDLPLGSSIAVLTGLERPIDCPQCEGTGKS